MPCAFVLALLSAGNNMPARMAMIAITTRSSINVKPAAAERQGRRAVEAVGVFIDWMHAELPDDVVESTGPDNCYLEKFGKASMLGTAQLLR
jgi:hypothetical protein